MSYRLKRTESVAAGVRRIAREQVERALELLADDTVELGVAVHQVRKHCKKVRALLRLVRSGARRVQRRENRVLRDLARTLSSSRDAEVAIRTWNRVAATTGGDGSKSAGPPEVLVEANGAGRESPADGTRDAIREARTTLLNLLDRVPGWRVEGRGLEVVGRGFEKTYRRARRAMRRVERTGSDEDYHEWRKHVKDHWYHLRLLQGVWPEVMRSERDEARRLAEFLGDEHDLTVLRERLVRPRRRRGRNAKPPIEAETLALLDCERERLRKRARRLGQRLLGETAASRLARLERLWTIWRPKRRR